MLTNDSYLSFLTADLKCYLGEWVAICDGKVISHDSSFRKAYAEARVKCPDKKPLMTKVPDEAAMVY